MEIEKLLNIAISLAAAGFLLASSVSLAKKGYKAEAAALVVALIIMVTISALWRELAVIIKFIGGLNWYAINSILGPLCFAVIARILLRLANLAPVPPPNNSFKRTPNGAA